MCECFYFTLDLWKQRIICCASELGFAGDIGAIEILIDWLIDWISEKWVGHNKPFADHAQNTQPFLFHNPSLKRCWKPVLPNVISCFGFQSIKNYLKLSSQPICTYSQHLHYCLSKIYWLFSWRDSYCRLAVWRDDTTEHLATGKDTLPARTGFQPAL